MKKYIQVSVVLYGPQEHQCFLVWDAGNAVPDSNEVGEACNVVRADL